MRNFFLMLLVCFSTAVAAAPVKFHKKPRPVKSSYIVVLDESQKPDVSRAAEALAKRFGVQVKSVWRDAIHGFAINAPEERAMALSRDPMVLFVEEDQEGDYAHCSFTHIVNPSGGCPDGAVPWQLDRIDQRDLPLNGTYEHCTYNTAEGVSVYIIDSGIAPHRDFEDANGNTRLVTGWNVALKNTDTNDCYGHGTYVASTAAGRFDGIAKSATVIPVKVSATCSATSTQYLIDAINWVKTNHVSGPAVANMSVTVSGSSAVDSAATALIADGVVLTVAAGNDYGSACGRSPQRVAGAITVGATDKTDTRPNYSNTGRSCVAVHAPGVATGGAHHPNYLAFNCNPGWGGTSVAAPQAAGVAAVIYKERYWYTPAQVKQELLNRATAGKVKNLPSGTPNRLLYSADPGWCPWMSCDSTPPNS